MHPALNQLHPYPFEKLRLLLAGLTPPAGAAPISMGVGEPRLPVPKLFTETLANAMADFSRYPVTGGESYLREAICGWLLRRFGAKLDPDTQVVPCAGTREALFSIGQVVAGQGKSEKRDTVVMPNPFYQIYEGAALWAGAVPCYVPALEENDFLPDYAGLPEQVLARTALLYLCSPNNPTGAVAPEGYLEGLIDLARRHGFVIVADECYSEIYPDESAPPPGILGVAQRMGKGFKNVLAFHSLSKRSSLPGARSGFVAGDAELIAPYLKARTYFGCTIPLPIQEASAAVWGDERHVADNRAAYRENFDAVFAVLGDKLPLVRPDGGFCLWVKVPQKPFGTGEAFSRKLYERCNITVLPGAYLSRPGDAGTNPGDGYVRMALVEPADTVAEAARRIAAVL